MRAIDVRENSDAKALAAAAAVRVALRTVRQNIAAFRDRYPADTTAGNRYPVRPATGGRRRGPTWAGPRASGRECSGSPTT